SARVGYPYRAGRYVQRQEAAGSGDPWQRTLGRMLLAACLSGVALLGTWGSLQWAPTWADQLKKVDMPVREWVQIYSGIGAIVGTILAALMGDWIGRRKAYCLLCLLSLGSVYLLYLGNREFPVAILRLGDIHIGDRLLACAFLAGGCTAAFYGWLPLYLPELFRTRVRATGQGFGFN